MEDCSYKETLDWLGLLSPEHRRLDREWSSISISIGQREEIVMMNNLKGVMLRPQEVDRIETNSSN